MQVVARCLRSEIEHQLKLHGYSLTKLAELTRIPVGNLSRILSLNETSRSMTIGQLDTLAMVFNQAPGWLYELYPDECYSEERLSRKRLVPYLVRCAEIGRYDCIEPIVSKMLDNPKNVSILFAVAERLFQNEWANESAYFYNLVIDSEKDCFSEPFVISQYRLFLISQGTNAEENQEAVVRFAPYRKRLPENLQLDGLTKLVKVCFTLQKWDKVEQYADELRELAETQYELQKRGYSSESLFERPLVYYYGMGSLLKGVALERQELYEAAAEYVRKYADLGWFESLDDAGKKVVEDFKVFAKANSYTLDVLMGKETVLADYAAYLADHPDEILPGLVTILKSVNQYGFCIDKVLLLFSDQIDLFDNFQDMIGMDQHVRFRYHKALYEFSKERFKEGIEETLYCLVLAYRMRRYEDCFRCSALFEKHRKYATGEQIQRFQAIMIGGEEVY
ncbi:DNA-binding protein [Paenibacillus sp. A3]|uniref:helix-turn-helix domain-containing protein n=1 Tax=Paenibacillus sp. A3 TaxID=1337054 RepID=UPI0006D594A3|nr:helix-turn-helix transcriptional regulator [Paenibacillus sp. A3]KPV60414.1 DNA-binding protein [Paenibacillus sp. A3]